MKNSRLRISSETRDDIDMRNYVIGMRVLTCSTIAIAFTSIAAIAESILPEGLPPGFDDLASQTIEMCGKGQRPSLPLSGFTQPHDINGDGLMDYVVESSSFRCWPEGSLIWGGTAGTAKFIYVSLSDGSFERSYAASGHAQQLVDIFGDGRAMAVVIFRHGLYCDLSGISWCVSAVVWDPITGGFAGAGHEQTH